MKGGDFNLVVWGATLQGRTPLFVGGNMYQILKKTWIPAMIIVWIGIIFKYPLIIIGGWIMWNISAWGRIILLRESGQPTGSLIWIEGVIALFALILNIYIY